MHNVLSLLDPARWTSPGLVAIRIVIIGVVSWILVAVLHRGIAYSACVSRASSPSASRSSARKRWGGVFRYIVSVVVSLIAAVLILSELGVSVAPIFGAAGVVGLAIGFGAQSLVKDYFTRFFILLENQITTGDLVRISDKTGFVET